MNELSPNLSLDFLNIHPRRARLAVAVSGGGGFSRHVASIGRKAWAIPSCGAAL